MSCCGDGQGRDGGEGEEEPELAVGHGISWVQRMKQASKRGEVILSP
jgi:hypothetical protein